MRELVRKVPLARQIQDYAVRVVLATHPENPEATAMSKQCLRYGASPRGLQAVILAAKIRALLEGRYAVSIDDIRHVATPALRHRLIMNFEGEAEGIRFAFDAIKVAPNTLDAHRLIRWAGAMSEEVQNRLVRRLFQINFEEGGNLGDHAVLIEAAREAGMDVAVVEALLPSDADAEAVQNEIATASRMGITGVPCFLLEGKYAVMGAQDAATLTDAIRQIAEAKANGELENAG